MEKLIERYVYDVTRRLPEKEREEVGRELKANIYDMLSDHADTEEVKALLYQLGAPAKLAEQYRQNPRYLISPAVYDEYIRVLKWALPLVGLGMLTLGMILGAIEAISHTMADGLYFIQNILIKGISLGFDSAFWALLWITAGFIIAERNHAFKYREDALKWKVENLPEVPPNNKGKIPLSDSITELVITVFFSVIGILLCRGTLPIPFLLLRNGVRINSIFHSDFLTACIPAVIVMALLGILVSLLKIRKRFWDPFMCAAVVVKSMVTMCITLYLLSRPGIFSAEFITAVQSNSWGQLDIFRSITSETMNPLFLLITVCIVISSLGECGAAIYKTKKYTRK